MDDYDDGKVEMQMDATGFKDPAMLASVLEGVVEHMKTTAYDVMDINGGGSDAVLPRSRSFPSPAHRLAWLADHLAELPGSGIVYTLTVAAATDVFGAGSATGDTRGDLDQDCSVIDECLK